MRVGYIAGTSSIHRMNSIVKLAWMFGTVILASLFLQPLPLLLLWVFHLFAALVLARLPWRRFMSIILRFIPLAIGYMTMNFLFHEGGSVVWRLGPFDVKSEGITVGLALGFRVLTILTSAFLFSMTTDPRNMVLSLIQKLKVSYRIGYGMYAALRFMPLARDEFESLRSARTVRGVGRRSGPIGLMREYMSYAIPLLATMIRKAIRTAIAMESKAFGAYPTRTYLEIVTIPWTDIVLLVALLGIEIGLVLLPRLMP